MKLWAVHLRNKVICDMLMTACHCRHFPACVESFRLRLQSEILFYFCIMPFTIAFHTYVGNVNQYIKNYWGQLHLVLVLPVLGNVKPSWTFYLEKVSSSYATFIFDCVTVKCFTCMDGLLKLGNWRVLFLFTMFSR